MIAYSPVSEISVPNLLGKDVASVGIEALKLPEKSLFHRECSGFRIPLCLCITHRIVLNT